MTLDELKPIGAWMRDAGVARLSLPNGLYIEMGAPPPKEMRLTLKEQQASVDARKKFEEAMQFAATEGIPNDLPDFGSFE